MPRMTTWHRARGSRSDNRVRLRGVGELVAAARAVVLTRQTKFAAHGTTGRTGTGAETGLGYRGERAVCGVLVVAGLGWKAKENQVDHGKQNPPARVTGVVHPSDTHGDVGTQRAQGPQHAERRDAKGVQDERNQEHEESKPPVLGTRGDAVERRVLLKASSNCLDEAHGSPSCARQGSG